uniref:Uncharacterized protein n=1 Tax=Arundo donax TaxID=35708 RepID=A0A0A9B0F2_ARUDO
MKIKGKLISQTTFN